MNADARWAPLKISAVYLGAGALWILLSDQLLYLAVKDPVALTHWQTHKGWLFVAVTAGVLHLIVSRTLSRVREAESVLREHEERSSAILRNLPNGIVHILDRDFRYVFNAGEELKRIDLSNENLVGKSIFEVLPPEAAETAASHYRKTLRGETVSFEGDFRGRHYLVSAVPLKGGGGEIANILVLSIDATDRHEALKALRASEAKYRALVEASPSLVTLMDRDGNYLHVNRTAAKFFGRRQEDIIGRNVADLLPPNVVEEVKEDIRKTYETKDTIRRARRLDRKEGTFFMQSALTPILTDRGDVEAVLVITHDVSEEKRALEALEKSEEKYRSLFEDAQDMIHIVGPGGRILDANPAELNKLGYAREELIGKRLIDLVHPDFREVSRKAIASLVEGIKIEPYQTAIVAKNGETIEVEVSATPQIEEGKIVAFRGILRDVTERNLAERKIREQERSLSEMSRIAKIGAWEFDPATGKGAWTEETARIHGLDPNDPTNVEIGLSFYEGESRRTIEAAVARSVEAGEPYDLELELTDAGGTRKWVRTIARPLLSDGKTVKIDGTFQDITVQKKAEQKIRQINKAYQVLLACNKTLLHAKEEEGLLEEICRVVVELGEYRFAWVGMAARDEGKSVLRAAEHGREENCLEKFDATWDDGPRGQGPTARAIRTGEPFLARAVDGDPACAPWSDEGAGADCDGCIALPLRVNGHVEGALTIHSDRGESFNPEEVELLSNLAEDLSFGLGVIRNRREKARLEEQLRRLAQELMVVRDRERANLSHELHDELGQQVTALMLQLESAKAAGRFVTEKMLDVERLAEKMKEELRRICLGLRPSALDRLGLVRAMESGAREMEAASKIKVDLDVEGVDERALDPDLLLCVYRIFQEAMTNVVRHSKAARAHVRFRREGNELTLSVEDDGKGVARDLPPHPGLGILGMRERAAYWNGTLDVEAAGGGGSRVTARIPIPPVKEGGAA